ncbi:S-layer domain-containing protein [Desulfotomaculum nigrificans CO-1-SRB]|uniref:S-layer domain-containing protein n=1 Tax=Desulfotomaculum nigrificans (strain DSM 14880 / VKM B-2319 / CO-1-SRB) TaxID=868595 RepID=F6B6N5_DESCC|nr:S-layer homology domain-containing protein [Desulfotomaculum nigrificans]AEF94409.1 S-layer domain-containing protein [Desulfotomaculum nigrificans CO-1-SRB]
MQKKIGYMLLGAVLLGATSLMPIGAGQADEINPLPVSPAEPNVITNLNKAVTNNYITRAELAIQLVDRLDLNLDGYRFLKAPQVTDFFSDVSVDDPCANAVMVLGYNGIVNTTEKSYRPKDKISREELAKIFANVLRHKAKDDIIKVQQIPEIKDLSAANNETANDIKLTVGLGIMTLRAGGNFQPKQGVTYDEFSNALSKLQQLIQVNNSDISAKIISQQDGTRAVEISWGEKPSSGYVIKIVDMKLKGNTLLVIYHTEEPAPGSFNSTVITEPKDSKPIPQNFPAQLNIELRNI